MSEATDAAHRLLEATVTDPDALADVYADKVVIEMPFAAPLFPAARETTREELRAGFARTGRPRYTRVSNVRVHETAEPNTAVLEYRLHGVTDADEREFALDYIMVIATEHGRIVRSRDYTSVVQAAQAMGMTEQLVAALRPTI